MWLARIYSSTPLPFWNILSSFENYCCHLFSVHHCHGHFSSFVEGFHNWSYSLPDWAITFFVLYAFEQPKTVKSQFFSISSLIIFTSIQFYIHNDSESCLLHHWNLLFKHSFFRPSFLISHCLSFLITYFP